MFKRSPSADTIGITTMGEVEVAPARIVRRFGKPTEGDGYKVSGQFVFIDQKGNVFVVHDWKSTNLWDEDFATPGQFWANEEPEELCIASRDVDTAEFKHWFIREIGIEPERR